MPCYCSTSLECSSTISFTLLPLTLLEGSSSSYPYYIESFFLELLFAHIYFILRYPLECLVCLASFMQFWFFSSCPLLYGELLLKTSFCACPLYLRVSSKVSVYLASIVRLFFCHFYFRHLLGLSSD